MAAEFKRFCKINLIQTTFTKLDQKLKQSSIAKYKIMHVILVYKKLQHEVTAGHAPDILATKLFGSLKTNLQKTGESMEA